MVSESLLCYFMVFFNVMDVELRHIDVLLCFLVPFHSLGCCVCCSCMVVFEKFYRVLVS